MAYQPPQQVPNAFQQAGVQSVTVQHQGNFQHGGFGGGFRNDHENGGFGRGGGYRGGYQGGGAFRGGNRGGFGSGFGAGGFNNAGFGGGFIGGGGGPGGGFGGGPAYTRDDRPEDELFKDHTAGIDFSKYEEVEVTVRPNNVPGVETFTAMDFHGLLSQNIGRCGYMKPTPVQKYGIPVVLQGKDLMACAQTGSGKTAAYLLPALNFTLKNSQFATPCRQATPTSLIMAPTRELSIQIYDEGRKFTYRTGLRCVVVYGGASANSQIRELQRGCNIVMATPGRLLEMFQRGMVAFSGIQFLVLDEADRMLDMGFEPQIRQIVERCDMPATGQRQTLMYSATFPREIQQLAREFLSRDHYFLQVGRVGSTTENITQELRWVDEHSKRDTLVELLRASEHQSVLVFVEKKRTADFLERFLSMQMGILCCSIHGDRSQRDREESLGMFKTGMRRVLVATDVAARGLDIPSVSTVVQFDLPTNIEDYTHRIGRTGRAGKKGVAIGFFNDNNRNIVDDLVPLMNESKQTVPEFLQAMFKPKRPNNGNSNGNSYRGRGRGNFNGGLDKYNFNRNSNWNNHNGATHGDWGAKRQAYGNTNRNFAGNNHHGNMNSSSGGNFRSGFGGGNAFSNSARKN